jgi:ornithine--oxo-acid transaminase
MTGRQMSEALMARGILAKDTHGSTVRFAPPLVASDEDITGLVAAVTEILAGA